MTQEEFVRLARAARDAESAAGLALLDLLYDVEKNHPEAWQGSGHSFETFIEDVADVCKATRYLRYKATREGAGVKAMEGASVNAVIAAGSMKTPQGQREVLDEARRHQAVNGTALSEQTANTIAREVGLRMAPKSTFGAIVKQNDRAKDTIEDLRQKLAARDATISALRAEVRAAQAEIARLKRAGKPSKPEAVAA